MFLIDWMFDKMGYTKKMNWLTILNDWEGEIKATPKKKVVRKAAVKKTPTKTVRKKNA